VPFDDALVPWIRALRARLERGDLADLPPVDIGYGTRHLPGVTTVRVMLADLDHLDDLPPEAAEIPRRRAELLDDFRRLRAAIG
jgi:hypothetical protein